MGSTYANVTVVGAEVAAVQAALAGTGAHLAQSGADVVVFSPHDEGEGMGGAVTASHLSEALAVPVVEALVFDEDFLTLQVAVNGAVVARAVAPPTGAEIMGEMGGDLIGSGLTSAEEAAALVAAIGRGDLDQVRDALEAGNVFASESHHAVFAALGLPTLGVGWGHRYLEQDRELFDAVPLVTA
ncbi:hypothetical protein [Aquihabitans sp. McL0605]|uniref:hypothetical protein n=1 Tax=Aquihabitans sp. McL0605 TaxID=3415671 RepID=UPI003CF13DE0